MSIARPVLPTTTFNKNAIEILIVGSGGQGVVLAGTLLGMAVTFEKRYAVQTATFGAAQRGTPVYTGIIVSDTPIKFSFVRNADFFIAISQIGFDTFCDKITKNTTLLLDSTLVKNIGKYSAGQVGHLYRIPAFEIARQFHTGLVTNIIMLGILIRLSKIANIDSLKYAIKNTVSKKYIEVNIKALEKGYSDIQITE